MRQSLMLCALVTGLLVTGGPQVAGQQPAVSIHVLKISSGPSGSEVNGTFALTSERSTFNRNDDREVIVLFEWDGVPGAHRLVAQWRSPDSAVTSNSAIDYVARAQRFGAYWSLPLSASMSLGTRHLNQLLREHGFDDFVEAQCAGFYAETMDRPGLPPGMYFRLLLIGYFEGIDSERGIAWRAADSFALRDFLGDGLEQAPPDHSTISRTRRLIDLETHRAVFTWVLQCLSTAGLVKGKTIGIDATTLEANAALRSIVRRDSGESYEEFLTTLANASGIGTPTRADLARIDRKRKKKGSNADWTHPHDPDAKITKMKDGRTHLAHKAEHAIDLDTGAIVGVTVQGADEGDTTTIQETLPEAAEQLEAVAAVTDDAAAGSEEGVADQGYHGA